MNNVLIYGNGKSRLDFKPRKFENISTWGCNRIYRENIHVDNLVAVDYIRQHEIIKDNYTDSTLWFSDWHELPKEFIDKPAWGSRYIELLKLGFEEDEIFENDKGSKYRCVVRGKNPNTAMSKFINSVDDGMSKDTVKQLKHKCMRNTGLYISWITGKEKINDINEFEKNSSGSTSMYFACKQGAKNIYLLGFDLATLHKPLSNVHLFSDYNKGFDSTMWQNQMKTVMRKFKNVNFYWVSQEEHKDKFQGISNLEFITIEDLNKWIDQTQ
tara:strand:+ start:91 stop:900 length:810 start_codon:yes stop_codon:yes gene_type:complete